MSSKIVLLIVKDYYWFPSLPPLCSDLLERPKELGIVLANKSIWSPPGTVVQYIVQALQLHGKHLPTKIR